MALVRFEKVKQKLADSTELEVEAQGTKVVFSVNFPGNPDADRFVQELTQEAPKEDKPEEKAVEEPVEKPEAEKEAE